MCTQFTPARSAVVSGRNLELHGGGIAGESLREPQVGADRGARILQRLHLARAARKASGQVEDLREVTALRAMDRDAEARVCGRQVHSRTITSATVRRPRNRGQAIRDSRLMPG